LSPDSRQLRRNFNPAFGRVLFAFLCLALAAGVLAPNHAAHAAIALVNVADNTANGPATSLSQTVAVTSGNLLVVLCRQNLSDFDLQSVSDTAGNTFFPVIASTIPRDENDMIKMWYAKNTKGNAADAVTCNFGQSISNLALEVLQYSGADPVAPLDAKTTGVVESSAGTDSASATTTAFSTAAASEVIVACGSFDSSGSISAGPGYTREADTGSFLMCEDWIVSQKQQNVSATMNSPNLGGWELVLGSFKAYVQGTTVSSRSDTLADSRPSATSNHTFAFTVNTAVTAVPYRVPAP
jgi:hypothetical protein